MYTFGHSGINKNDYQQGDPADEMVATIHGAQLNGICHWTTNSLSQQQMLQGTIPFELVLPPHTSYKIGATMCCVPAATPVPSLQRHDLIPHQKIAKI